MNTQDLGRCSGFALAVIAAGLASHSTPASAKTAAAKVDLVHCSGINLCKGHNDCKTAANVCAGHGSCKGQGFVAIPAKACGDAGGEVIDAGMSVAVDPSSFVHCMGANVCKGHNDCKTATNACKGQGSCKGQGFIAIPKKACGDIGGKVG